MSGYVVREKIPCLYDEIFFSRKVYRQIAPKTYQEAGTEQICGRIVDITIDQRMVCVVARGDSIWIKAETLKQGFFRKPWKRPLERELVLKKIAKFANYKVLKQLEEISV